MTGDRYVKGRSFFDSYKLKPRGHGLSRAEVREHQRWRLIGSCAHVLARRGYSATTLNQVVFTAAVSKKTFYEHFDGLADCILRTYEAAARDTLGVLEEACRSASDRETGLPIAVSALLGALTSEPELGAALLDPALLDVPGVGDAKSEFTSGVVRLLAEERSGTSELRDLQQRFAHLIGGTQYWLWSRLQSGQAGVQPVEATELSTLLGWR